VFTLRIIRNPQIQNAASLTGKVDGAYSNLSALRYCGTKSKFAPQLLVQNVYTKFYLNAVSSF
jgi:hypothetical protein